MLSILRGRALFRAGLLLLGFATGAVGAGDSGYSSGLAMRQPGEELPGGAATSRYGDITRNAFSQPSGNISALDEFKFEIGNAIFRKSWVSAPASTKSSDGLGPLFNARSCQRCHLKDGRGHPPAANWPRDDAVSMVLRLSIPPETKAQKAALASRRRKVIAEPTYGTQLQDLAIQGQKIEGRIHITYREHEVTLAGGRIALLREPDYKVSKLGFAPLHDKVMISPRIAPQMIGLGLLEAVPKRQILALADPDDGNGDGISGRPNQVWSITRGRAVLGRFGWKAASPDLRQQSAEAFAGDIGMSSSLKKTPAGDCTARQLACVNAPNGVTKSYGAYEVSDKLLDLVTFYARNLAVPRRRAGDDPGTLRGKALFHATGCAQCHRPNFTTGDKAASAHLRGQLIWPYSDLLLHDMGEGLADHRPEGLADGREWRTAPLWGIGLTKTVSGHTFFLHDGRARNIAEAILWHGGEAKASRNAFKALPIRDRARLIKFVKSL